VAKSRPWAGKRVSANRPPRSRERKPRRPRPTAVASARNRDVVDLFTWIRTNLPCDSRILADVHSEGVFQALTGRVSLLEGATPYLRRNVRDRVVGLFLDARAFLRDPIDNEGFVRRHGVDYLVLLQAGRVGYREPIGRVNRSRLQRAQFLRLIHRAAGGEVFRVTGASQSSSLPVQSFPGYRCQRGPIVS
jgi:hypothetical protein